MAKIQITIDDGPKDTSSLNLILTEVRRHGVKAAFFNIGEEIRDDGRDTKAILKDNHVIGNHSWDHLKKGTSKYKDHEIYAQFSKTHLRVKQVANYEMVNWRAPRNEEFERLEKILTEGATPLYALTHCEWHADSGDSQGNHTKDDMLDTIRKHIKSKPTRKTFRLLFHVLPTTAKHLPAILDALINTDGHKLVDFQQTT